MPQTSSRSESITSNMNFTVQGSWERYYQLRTVCSATPPRETSCCSSRNLFLRPLNWTEIKERNIVSGRLLMVCVFKFDATPLPVFELVLNIADSCIAAGVAQSNANKIVQSFIHNRQKARPLHFQFLRSCHRTETGVPFSHLLKTLPKPSFLFNSYYASPVFFKASFEVMDPKARKLWFWKGATLQTFTLEHFRLVFSDHTTLGILKAWEAWAKIQQRQWQHFHGWPYWGSSSWLGQQAAASIACVLRAYLLTAHCFVQQLQNHPKPFLLMWVVLHL